MAQNQYYIAVLPDAGLQEEIYLIKKWTSDKYSTAKALNSPAHITLIPPFSWSDSLLSNLTNRLQDFAKKQRSFQIDLHNYACFEPRVIFIRVLPNEPLTRLQDKLRGYLTDTPGIPYHSRFPFHPHITIAFRDLPEKVFQQAWDHFSGLEYRRSFIAHNIALLRHEGLRWQVVGTYSMLENE